MKNWMSGLFKEDVAPENVFQRYDVRARVSKHPRSDGIAGRFVDLDLHVDDEWVLIGMVSDTRLRETIIVLQEALEFIGKEDGVTLLHTIRAWGGAYYVDVRSGEFRNVDNPYDRIKTERVE